MKHDPYGPSTHPMLVKCPAYSSTQSETVHTVKGTEKHHYCELFLDPKAEHFADDTEYLYELLGESNDGREGEYKFDAEDISDVITAIDQAREFIRDMEDKTAGTKFNNIVKVNTEQWVNLNLLGISGGTPDLVLTIGKSTIIIIDFKFGRIPVSPQSEQLMSYMCGLNPFGTDFKHMYNVIIQPKVYEEAQVYTVTQTHLAKHMHMMKEVIELAKLDNPPYIAHDKCNWCDKHLKCPATIGQLAQTTNVVKANKAVKIYDLPDAQLTKWIDQYEMIKSFGGALKQELYARLHRGEDVDGYELSAGRRSRRWKDEQQTLTRLKELCKDAGVNAAELYDSKLLSVAKIEKLLPKHKKEIAELFYHQDGNLVAKKIK
jgi:hypothetical protein|tara:strand:- start:671 stop:1795 length:1125 start_codon:yes stop_codon:yes gene_type:complete